jgi:hypothetical protein
MFDLLPPSHPHPKYHEVRVRIRIAIFEKNYITG